MRSVLGDAYRVERELPPGGMSRLFLATERSLDRRVVVKVLPPELRERGQRRPFPAEVTTPRSLQHPAHPAGALGRVARRTAVLHHSVRRRRVVARPDSTAKAGCRSRRRAHSDRNCRRSGPRQPGRCGAPRHQARQHPAAGRTRAAGRLRRRTGTARSHRWRRASPRSGRGSGRRATWRRNNSPVNSTWTPARTSMRWPWSGYEMLAGKSPFDGATPQAVAAAHFTSAPAPLSQIRRRRAACGERCHQPRHWPRRPRTASRPLPNSATRWPRPSRRGASRTNGSRSGAVAAVVIAVGRRGRARAPTTVPVLKTRQPHRRRAVHRARSGAGGMARRNGRCPGAQLRWCGPAA